MTSGLQFDAASHTYTLDGEILPSVTQILQSAGLVDYSRVPRDVLQAAMDRGTRVHLACQFLDEGDLDPASIGLSDMGYVSAYEKFKRETGFVPELIEHRVHHSELRFAGTLDRVGTFSGGHYRLLIDIKTGDPTPAAFVQLAAYQ